MKDNITESIEWLKAHGFKRDTRCRIVAFQFKGEWLADFGRTAHWFSSGSSTYVQEAIGTAFDNFMAWRMAKISELSDERLAAASIRKQLLGTNV